jgi:hypothetical protein
MQQVKSKTKKKCSTFTTPNPNLKMIQLYRIFTLLLCLFLASESASANTTNNFKDISTNLLLHPDCKIKIINYRGKVVKVLATNYIKHKNTLPSINLPKGRYWISINITDEKVGYWVTI